MAVLEYVNTFWQLCLGEKQTNAILAILKVNIGKTSQKMDEKYLYACVWTPNDDYVRVRTYKAYRACHLLDFEPDVSYFDRNRETLTYKLDGKNRQLTPELNVTYQGETFYLHCYKNGTVTQPMIDTLKEHYPIHFLGEGITLQEPLNHNVSLIRSRHHGKWKPANGSHLDVPDCPITARQLSQERNWTIGKANSFLVECVAYRLLTFDLYESFSENTVFSRLEK